MHDRLNLSVVLRAGRALLWGLGLPGFLALAACGQKGPLTFPQPKAAATVSGPTAVASAPSAATR